MPKYKLPSEYPVGYCKPPKDTQFKPGTSGNPKGRPKGMKSTGEVFCEIYNSKVTVTENGEPVRLSMRELLYKVIVKEGLKGKIQAMKMVLALEDQHLRPMLDAQKEGRQKEIWETFRKILNQQFQLKRLGLFDENNEIREDRILPPPKDEE